MFVNDKPHEWDRRRDYVWYCKNCLMKFYCGFYYNSDEPEIMDHDDIKFNTDNAVASNDDTNGRAISCFITVLDNEI